MTGNYIQAITDLPVIIQGALGSALCMAFVWLGQRIYTLISSALDKHSKNRRDEFLKNEILKCKAIVGKDFPERGAYLTLLLYQTSRYLAKALIWLTLGLSLQTMFGEFAIIGYMGAIYYLFGALNLTSMPKSVCDEATANERLKSLQKARRGEAPLENS